jgi:hypothetical protein
MRSATRGFGKSRSYPMFRVIFEFEDHRRHMLIWLEKAQQAKRQTSGNQAEGRTRFRRLPATSPTSVADVHFQGAMPKPEARSLTAKTQMPRLARNTKVPDRQQSGYVSPPPACTSLAIHPVYRQRGQ